MATDWTPKAYERQSELVDMPRVLREDVMIIGLGAIGRPLALGLAHMGIKKFHLVDFDKVEEVNIATQGYRPKDIDFYKIDCVYRQLTEIDSGIEVTLSFDKYQPALGFASNIFCCVDSIVTRQEIWDATLDQHRFWADARMLALSIRALCAYDEATRAHYTTTFDKPEDIVRGRCTARSAIWPSTIAAGLLQQLFVHYLNDREPPPELLLDLNSFQLFTAEELAKTSA